MSTDRNAENLETQIAIIGGGGGGLAAAVAAADSGADVIILEKRRVLGGNSAGAVCIFAAESPVQKRMNIPVTKDEVFHEWMRYTHWNVNPRIVRAYIEKSADTIQWFEDKGIKWDIVGVGANRFHLTCHNAPRYGAELIEVLIKDLDNLGVKYFCEAGVKDILPLDNEGMFEVVAGGKDGKELRVKAKSVIIATGGFGGNKEMLAKYCPYYNENVILAGLPHMGEGINIAIKLGAATAGLGNLQSFGGGRVKQEVHGGHLMNTAREPYTIWVNKRGQRFIDENFIHWATHTESVGAIARQPGGAYYSIIDDKMRQQIVEGGVSKGFHNPPGTKFEDLTVKIEAGVKKGSVKASDSWDEIAGWIEAQPEDLKTTVDEYNSFCDKGHDDLFGKDPTYLIPLRTPPYYAIKCVIHFPCTFGGIKINEYMEVLDMEDNPIPGVYGAGVDCGDWETECYNLYYPGHGFGFALNSGRMAGENAAKYVLVK